MLKFVIFSIALFHLAYASPLTAKTVERLDTQDVQASNSSCVVCEFVIHIFEDLAVDNLTEPEAEKLLELICNNLFPTPIRSECSAFVAQYGKIVISLLVNGLDPQKVCRTILLCPKFDDVEPQGGEIVVIDTQAKNDSLQCSLCIYFTELVQELLKSNKTDAEIAKELESICTIFPSDLKDQCVSFLDEYLPEVIRLIDSDIDPEKACAYLKLCPKSIVHDIYQREFVNRLPTK